MTMVTITTIIATMAIITSATIIISVTNVAMTIAYYHYHRYSSSSRSGFGSARVGSATAQGLLLRLLVLGHQGAYLLRLLL